MEVYGYIYKTTINDKDDAFNGCYYIGQKKAKEIDEKYWGSGAKLKSYISRRGTERLEREILEWSYSKDELEKAERKYIDAVWSKDIRCLNAARNTVHSEMSEEARRRNSERQRIRMLGNTYTLGYKHTPEALAKISKRAKELWQTPEYRASHKDWSKGKNNPMYGKKHTPETLAKIRRTRQKQAEEKKKAGFRWWTDGNVNKLSIESPGKNFRMGRSYKRRRATNAN